MEDKQKKICKKKMGGQKRETIEERRDEIKKGEMGWQQRSFDE